MAEMHLTRNRSLVSFLVAALFSFGFTAPASALMDIEQVEIFWIHDNVDGSPAGPNPYAIDIMAFGEDIDSITVTPPVGGISAFTLDETAPDDFEHNPPPTTEFSTSALMFADYPAGLWRFDFVGDGGASNDFFEITLTPTVVTDMLDITSPSHLGSMLATDPVTWSDCSACDGNRLVGFAIDTGTDSDVDWFDTTDLAETTWNPSNLVAGNTYDFEMILGNYSNFFSPEATNGGDAFDLIAGYESINIVEVDVVPEPGTALLLGAGLLGLAARRRL